MTDPSNPDLVEQLAEKCLDGYIAATTQWEEIEAFKWAIREAISVTRRETLEQAAKHVESLPDDFCSYKNGALETSLTWSIAAEIRRIGENK